MDLICSRRRSAAHEAVLLQREHVGGRDAELPLRPVPGAVLHAAVCHHLRLRAHGVASVGLARPRQRAGQP